MSPSLNPISPSQVIIDQINEAWSTPGSVQFITPLRQAPSVGITTVNQLIDSPDLKLLTDQTGKFYSDLAANVDLANMHARMLQNILAKIFTIDPSQQNAWFPYAQGIITSGLKQAVSATGLASPLAVQGFGVGGGSFGQGNGVLARAPLFAGIFYSWLRGIDKQIYYYANLNGLSTIADLVSFAKYYNAVAQFSVTFTPDFAAAYFYGYSKQLDPSSVFAPRGILLGTGTITGANSAQISNNAATQWPTANGYTTPVPTNTGAASYDQGAWSSAKTYSLNDNVLYSGVYYVSKLNNNLNVTPGTNTAAWVANTFGNNVYLGNMPVAQGFCANLSPEVVITQNVNGTAYVTITAKNQAGITRTWYAIIDNATAGTTISLLPKNYGDRMNSVANNITVAGTATAGVFTIQTGAPERTP